MESSVCIIIEYEDIIMEDFLGSTCIGELFWCNVYCYFKVIQI